MTRYEIFKLAEQYMNNRKVHIVLPGRLGQCRGDRVEVIFLNPIALETDVALTKEVTLIYKM